MAVRKRKDRNSWEVDVRIGGRRIREAFKTKREALARERELIAQEVTGTFRPSNAIEKITFARFIPQYLAWASVNKAKRTVRDEERRIRGRLTPFFGEMVLSEIDAFQIDRYKEKRYREGMHPRTINIELTLLSVIFKVAMRRGYARDNPVRHVERMKEPKRPPRFLSEDEVARLLEAARSTYLYPLILAALHTGMRRSELFHLQWDDVDFANGTITVQPKEDWHTKNYGYRVIEMTDTLKEVLRAEYERRNPNQPYVFTYNGERIRWNIERTFKRILREAGITNCTVHTLRHTFASHLAMQGVPLLHIQQLLGHRDYTTTLVYAHLSKESLRGQVHKLPFDRARKEP